MDLSVKAIQEVIHPTAAFTYYDDSQVQPTTTSPTQVTWDNSLLNPKNRIDSLDLPQCPLWRIDGCSSLGMQYYAIPLFLSTLPPMRMDVFIHENQPEELRQQLELNIAFHTKDGARLSNLAISKYIIRVLGRWVMTAFEDLDAFEKFYRSVPFGTRLVLEKLSTRIQDVVVAVGRTHVLEHRLLSLPKLKEFWGSDFPFPNIIDLYELQVIRVLHDSVCLVRIGEELFIFKALMSGTKYLYHELKILCNLGSHPNVIGRPIHLVRKACNFGAKKAIVGFTTFYHCNGSLRDVLPQLRIHGKLSQAWQLTWAAQLTNALEHLRSTSGTYYPDLRLDNIVLSTSLDIVMVDFEQRGVWCEFAAPEVNAIEYIRFIATDERADEQDERADERLFPRDKQSGDDAHEKYWDMLRRLVPAVDVLEKNDDYVNAPQGYNVPWIALDPTEQEAAEVYMLGRVLWCIFEGVSGPQKAAVWQSYPWESDLEFPDFRQTPDEMRPLIERCARGRRQTLGSIIEREGSRLVLKGVPLSQQNPKDVQDAARRFWQTELQVAEEFLAMREVLKEQGNWPGNYYQRPTLREVLAELLAYQSKTV
ncbi:hypothetical protein BKA67DRAFT_653181 [Truncatella angustata]|uniref:Protein kinase domain-containing protein n=1 Tax=Truncatella angustata TaxID=152316 RepID=A0A9P8UXH3_9PEZI|nr:uncharacterized protein BKA67DRAFT_653181 [Truncatella angustata]KAH6659978.1 hypothetical protein BKA67DRAFT_653181 [Truncatella angustata]KAH8197147.1 hypothetical protein TruAng_008676 [Truncatella angustata]